MNPYPRVPSAVPLRYQLPSIDDEILKPQASKFALLGAFLLVTIKPFNDVFKGVIFSLEELVEEMC